MSVPSTVTFGFLAPTATDVVARSPMERQARAAGARFELRDGWNVAVAFPGEARARASVAFSDCSHVRKYELPRRAARARVRPRDRRRRLDVAADDRARGR